MTANLVIVDYGMGNLRSVQKALEAVGQPATISANPNEVAQAEKLILPGVGAFPDAMMRLHETGLGEAVKTHVATGRPFLGICLGLHLLFTRGLEGTPTAGLGIWPGDVVPFDPAVVRPIPHMGWNTLAPTRPDCPLLAGMPPDPAVYFVHGFYAHPTDPTLTAATADYPTPFLAVAWRDNVFATQFHPEKSQRIGLKMLANFAAL